MRVDNLEWLQDEAYIRPYSICPNGKDDDEFCPIDGTIEFCREFDEDGKLDWRPEEECPECGAELEIRERVEMKTDVELVPDAVVAMARNDMNGG